MEQIIYCFLLGPLSALGYSLVIYNSKFIDLSIKECLFCTIINYISFILGYFIKATLAIPISLLLLFIYLFCRGKNKYSVILTLVIAVLVINLTDIISGFSIMYLSGKSFKYVTENLNYSIAINISTFFTSIIISKYGISKFKKIPFNKTNNKYPKYNFLIIISLCASVLIVYLNVTIAKLLNLANNRLLLVLYILSFSLYIIINLTLIQVYGANIKKFLKLKAVFQ